MPTISSVCNIIDNTINKYSEDLSIVYSLDKPYCMRNVIINKMTEHFEIKYNLSHVIESLSKEEDNIGFRPCPKDVTPDLLECLTDPLELLIEYANMVIESKLSELEEGISDRIRLGFPIIGDLHYLCKFISFLFETKSIDFVHARGRIEINDLIRVGQPGYIDVYRISMEIDVDGFDKFISALVRYYKYIRCHFYVFI